MEHIAPANRNAPSLPKNRRTVEAYERCAHDYAKSVSGPRSEESEHSLQRLIEAVGPGGHILEVGSGPGWDADFLEARGLAVRRTDITNAFVEFQLERGRKAERLDLIDDDLGGPYDGIMALYVLQHIDRELVDEVLRKISGALRPGGAFLVALREGDGEYCEKGTISGGLYLVVMWALAEFREKLAAAGLDTEWIAQMTGEEGQWMTLLARKNDVKDEQT